MQAMCDSSFLLRAVTDRRLMQHIRHRQADTCACASMGGGGGQKKGKKGSHLRQLNCINKRQPGR